MAKNVIEVREKGGEWQPFDVLNWSIRLCRVPEQDGSLGSSNWTIGMLSATRERSVVKNGEVPHDSISVALASLQQQDAYIEGRIRVFKESDRNNPIAQLNWSNGHVADLQLSSGTRTTGVNENVSFSLMDLEIDGYPFTHFEEGGSE